MKKRLSIVVCILMVSFYVLPIFTYAQTANFTHKDSGLQDGKKNVFGLSKSELDAFKEQLLLKNQNSGTKIFHRKVLSTVFVISLGYLILALIIHIVNSRITNIKVRHTVRKNFIYIITFIVFIGVFFIWIQNISSLTIFLGVASAGLALALQEVILCVAGWLLIIMRRPFEVGDRIEINGIQGDIIDIRLFQTSMLEIGNWVDADQSTGRIVSVPNSFVFKHSNYNYSRGFEFIWNEIPILVTFESDWVKAKDIITERANKLAEGMEAAVRRKIEAMRNRYMIFYGPLTPIVYVNIKDSGVELTLRYLTEAKQRRSTQDLLCREILEDFSKEESVHFAYPTYRIVKS